MKNNFFDNIAEDLIWLELEMPSKEELFCFVGKELYEKGYVKKSFSEALLHRESNFPTGLPTEPFSVAIPHTDVIHVNRECVVCVRPRNPIIFKNMGEPEEDIFAELIFILCITAPQKQLDNLKSIINMVSDVKKMNNLKKAQNTKEFYQFIMCK